MKTLQTLILFLIVEHMTSLSSEFRVSRCNLPGFRNAVVQTNDATFYLHHGVVLMKDRASKMRSSCKHRFPIALRQDVDHLSTLDGMKYLLSNDDGVLGSCGFALDRKGDVYAVDKGNGSVRLLSPNGTPIIWSPPSVLGNHYNVSFDDTTVTVCNVNRLITYHLERRIVLRHVMFYWKDTANRQQAFLYPYGKLLKVVFGPYNRRLEKVISIPTLNTVEYVFIDDEYNYISLPDSTKSKFQTYPPSHPFMYDASSIFSRLVRDLNPSVSWSCRCCYAWPETGTTVEYYDMVADAHGNVFLSSSKGISIIPATYTDDSRNAALAITVLEAGVVYPNPATTHVTCQVDVSSLNQPNATLIDLNGRPHATKPLEGTWTHFDISTLPTGTYGLVLSTTNAKVFRTLVISR